MNSNSRNLNAQELASFCRKKGFLYQSSEIYGGVSGVYDYGHIGTLLKKNFQNSWIKYFKSLHENFYEIQTGQIMHERVFKASGHLENFYDPIVEIEGQDETFRADHLIEEKLSQRAEDLTIDEMKELIVSKKLLGDIDYSKVKITNLNLMFDVHMGPTKGTKAYLRPETAQSPFVNFKAQFELQRKKLPMGLMLIGKVFRNEISPRNLNLRTREFEQAELQIFFNPNTLNEKHNKFDEIKDIKLPVKLVNSTTDNEVEYKSVEELLTYGVHEMYAYYLARVFLFYRDVLKLNINLRFLELNEKERAFYNKMHFDIEMKMHSINKWVEIGGVHYRTNHDLSSHEKESNISMTIQDEARQEKVLPHVLELSFGVDRNLYAIIDQSTFINEENNQTTMHMTSKLSPISVGIFPLMNKEPLTKVAYELKELFVEEDIETVVETSGSVGKRYARNDEIGTAYCITIDYETIEEGDNKDTITIRNRDTQEQKRVHKDEVVGVVKQLLRGKISFEEL
ncbi:MAG: glycine--tRNA ligase [Nanoarchaeota archaeon]|nr:glycine--tRNA ligase [Nanoarchaeota archaeon]